MSDRDEFSKKITHGMHPASAEALRLLDRHPSIVSELYPCGAGVGALEHVRGFSIVSVSIVAMPPDPWCVLRHTGETVKQAWIRLLVATLRDEINRRSA